MRIAVLGAGAIGAYVGAALARGGAEVHLVARGANLEAMRRDGIRVLSPRGDFEARPPATEDPRDIGPVDVVFLGLKAHAYGNAGPLLDPLMDDETAVVAAQNGIPWWYFHGLDGPFSGHRVETVDPGGEVSRVIAPERAIGCVVYAGTELEAPGVVRHLEGTRFTIGEPDGSMSDRCRQFSEAMVAGGLKCPVETTELRNEVWVKLMGNVSFNPLSALTRATIGGMCRYEPTRRLISAMMHETLEVAHALGAEPSVSVERRLAGGEKVGEHRTSTLQDLQAGKPLELGPIIEAVVELAELTEVPVPSLRAVAAASGLLAKTLELA
ncbi:MAG: 2-dehydropantoate 2-reductase [Solirubrobacteraceae bacterium]|jgi:2-dehydropantoate 2-reductase|nr:2-dehydropantoate 2-reductase [Solirubrobacteraceae bacterium]